MLNASVFLPEESSGQILLGLTHSFCTTAPLDWLSQCECGCECACVCGQYKIVMIASASHPFRLSSLVGPPHFLIFFFFNRCTWKYVYLKVSQEGKPNNRDCIYPPKATSTGYCQSLSRFHVKRPIHAVSIDQTTKCLFIFFSIQLVFLWLSDSSFISVSECPVLNG